jgi:xanthine dehydrogenase accessory factor
VGFDIKVLEDRREYADERRFPPGTTFQCGPVAESVAAIPKTPDTYIIIVTRGHQHDIEALKACLHSRAGYIGMIGSRRKVSLVRQSLLEARTATVPELDRIHAPIGLDIGAETVPEIATSIVAEMICVRRKGGTPPGSSMR